MALVIIQVERVIFHWNGPCNFVFLTYYLVVLGIFQVCEPLEKSVIRRLLLNKYNVMNSWYITMTYKSVWRHGKLYRSLPVYQVGKKCEVRNTARLPGSVPDLKVWGTEYCQATWQCSRTHWRYSGPHWRYSWPLWQYYGPQLPEKMRCPECCQVAWHCSVLFRYFEVRWGPE